MSTLNEEVDVDANQIVQMVDTNELPDLQIMSVFIRSLLTCRVPVYYELQCLSVVCNSWCLCSSGDWCKV